MHTGSTVADDETAAREHPEPSRWRPLVAAGLSLLVPGWGQWFVGRRRRAVPFFVVTGALLVIGAYLATKGMFSLLEIFVQPQWVWTLVIGNIAVFILRLISAADAFVVAGGLDQGRAGAVTAIVSVFLCFLLVAPHIFVGSKAASWLEVLGVFAADDAPGKRAHHPPAIEVDDPEIPVEVPHTWKWGVVLGAPDGRTRMEQPEQDLGGVLGPLDDERITVLLAGGDFGPGRSDNRTDVMIIATIDMATNRASLVSISRELVGFIVPPALQNHPTIVSYQTGWWNQAVRAQEQGNSYATHDDLPEEMDRTIWLSRINELYTLAIRADSPAYRGEVDPGLAALADSFELSLGIRIDYYAMVTMPGFVDFVDALGGVWVTNRETVDLEFSPGKPGDPWIELQLEPGVVFLDGRTALAYVRNRTGTSDLYRTRRQRCFIRELAGQIDATAVVRRFEGITRAVSRHTITNIPLRLLPAFVEAVGRVDRANIANLSIDFTNSSKEINYRNLGILDLPMARARMNNVLAGIGDPGAELRNEC
ncbi:MAG: LCP family protein [Acidimicrobiia bacterium]